MTKFEKRIAQFITDHLICIVFFIITVLGIWIRIQLREQLSGDSLGALLPAMHERYSYPYGILGWVLAFLVPQTAPLCIGLQLISLRTYSAYLFGASINCTWLAMGNVCLYGVYVYLFLRQTPSDSAIQKAN